MAEWFTSEMGPMQDHSVLSWEWASFWTQLAAGVITFGLGVLAAYFLLRHELSETRRADQSEFRNLAGEVCSELDELEIILTTWLGQIKARKTITPIDPPNLTWNIDPGQLRFAFARRGVQRLTQAAVDWFNSSVEIARVWNVEQSSKLSDDTERRAITVVSGAIERVRTARAAITSAAGAS